MSRTPRRAQQPKTLNAPEDSTYYNLIHVSLCAQGKCYETWCIQAIGQACYHQSRRTGVFAREIEIHIFKQP